MAPSTHFKLNNGTQIPAVGLGTIKAVVNLRARGVFADMELRNLEI
jgi:diketogulonate reductase-like aldo/keto reductase